MWCGNLNLCAHTDTHTHTERGLALKFHVLVRAACWTDYIMNTRGFFCLHLFSVISSSNGRHGSERIASDRRTFRDELQWAAEYSEARLAPPWPVIHKLVAKSISTFPATHLEQHSAFLYNQQIEAMSWTRVFLSQFHKQRMFPLAVPYTSQVPPRIWSHCPRGWSQWRPARETSACTWSRSRTAGKRTWSMRKSLRRRIREMMASMKHDQTTTGIKKTANGATLLSFSHRKVFTIAVIFLPAPFNTLPVPLWILSCWYSIIGGGLYSLTHSFIS